MYIPQTFHPVIIALLTLVPSGSRVQAPSGAPLKSTPPLWRTLTPGPLHVGYRTEYVVDSSRTWRPTHHFDLGRTPDFGGRPIRLSIWYPATVDPQSTRMAFGDYAHAGVPSGYIDFEVKLEERDSTIFSLTVQPNEMERLLKMPTAVYRNARPLAGRFPLVFLVGGLNAETTAEAVLAEFLASHGYVVVTVPWTGLTSDQFDAGTDQVALAAIARDLEFAWAHLRRRADVDPRHLALVGHSLGGDVSMMVAMENGDVDAVVGLDATYGMAQATSTLTGYYAYSANRMTAALLDLRKAKGIQNTVLDLSAEHGFHHSDRYFVTLQHIRHSEFTTYALISDVFNEPPIPPQFQVPGWSRRSAADRYDEACRMVDDFLDAILKSDSTGRGRLAAEVAASDGAEMTHEGSVPVVPSPEELVALARDSGFDRATAVVDRAIRENPGENVIPEGEYNNLGYSLVGARHFAPGLLAFRLAIHGHPRSANAYDSYGDGLLAAGDTAGARGAYRQALELAPADSTLSSAARQSLMAGDSLHLRALGWR